MIGILAFLTRFIGLSSPTDKGAPVFDEKHYAPQAWQMVRSWSNPFVGGIEDNPAYGLVVHPPVGKQIEMISEWLFGYNAFGWRAASATCGVIIILLIMGTVKRLADSTMIACMAGIIAICDGVLLVTQRTAMLDVFQCIFVVAAAYLLVRDVQQMQERMKKVRHEDRMTDSPWGPRMGYRWWRFTAGISIGLATGVKWSGLFYIFFFGLLSVMADLARRRRFGVQRPVLGTLGRDTFPAIASLAILPLAVYMFSWRAWFADENSVYRHAKESGLIDDGSILKHVPSPLSNWLYYHQQVLQFHATLTNSNRHYHPWESKPWSWLASTRPMIYYDSVHDDGTHYAQMLFGTPIIWWISVPVIAWAAWCWIVGKDRRWAVPVVGYAAGFLPWLTDVDRQMYFFYATNMIPFLIMAIALCLGQLYSWSIADSRLKNRALGKHLGGYLSRHRQGVASRRRADAQSGVAGNPGSSRIRPRAVGASGSVAMRAASSSRWARVKSLWINDTGSILACLYLGAVVAMFIYFLPLMVAMPLSGSEWDAHMWLPSWK